MGVSNIAKREEELMHIIWPKIEAVDNIHILASHIKDRLGVISFYIDNLHYNLAVKLLNDKFGIQTRGGCSCAGTYGHYLLHVSKEKSRSITESISRGDCSAKPGWVRLSLHPVMTDEEAEFIANAIVELAQNHQSWSKDYNYDGKLNEFYNVEKGIMEGKIIEDWFNCKL